MTDLPPPDLLDSTGRMRRLVVALLVGLAAGLAAFYVADAMATPDQMQGGFDGGSKTRAYRFVYYVAGFASAACFAMALAIQNHLAKKKWLADQVPRAQAR